jgi:hypothetical protein
LIAIHAVCISSPFDTSFRPSSNSNTTSLLSSLPFHVLFSSLPT